MFAADFEPAERKPGAARRALRFRSTSSIGKTGRTLCRVIDISIHGARLQTYSALKRGTSIWLNLPADRAGRRRGHVGR